MPLCQQAREPSIRVLSVCWTSSFILFIHEATPHPNCTVGSGRGPVSSEHLTSGFLVKYIAVRLSNYNSISGQWSSNNSQARAEFIHLSVHV